MKRFMAAGNADLMGQRDAHGALRECLTNAAQIESDNWICANSAPCLRHYLRTGLGVLNGLSDGYSREP